MHPCPSESVPKAQGAQTVGISSAINRITGQNRQRIRAFGDAHQTQNALLPTVKLDSSGLSCDQASTGAASIMVMISLSLVLCKPPPRSSSILRRSRVLVRLPLCDTPSGPSIVSIKNGCAFRS